MREIKFRGITGTKEGNKWVFGHYYRVKSFFNDNEGHYISTIRNDHLQDYSIDENTIGQYTGLKDKNGKEIYEGDIVKISGKETDIGKVIYEYDGFTIDVTNMDKWYGRAHILEKFTEVIGNIYDNPELLKEENK